MQNARRTSGKKDHLIAHADDAVADDLRAPAMRRLCDSMTAFPI